MKLTKAHVTNFKSITDSTEVNIDPSITVLVGQNESGKTAFLQALHKANPVQEGVQYDVIEDYPRKDLSAYEEQHEATPARVLQLTFELLPQEVKSVNDDVGFNYINSLTFSITYNYKNHKSITLVLNEGPVVKQIVKESPFPKEIIDKCVASTTVSNLIAMLEDIDLNTESGDYLAELKAKYAEPPGNGWSLLQYRVWSKLLAPNLPKFLYFDDYKILPGKINLQTLKNRLGNGTATEQDNTVSALLRLAKVEIDDLLTTAGYEKNKARLEGISNAITDKIFKYWKQTRDLEVQFDVKEDPSDTAPYNSGNNLYIRIRSQRHRVSVPFNQRSKGFIWFFSFLVWFDRIKQQLETDKDLILLLDEPGLSLHALAQSDLLDYIDELSAKQQILYTTHSPFMVKAERLHQVRTVEDLVEKGTTITDNVSGSDPKTLFPLQAALGYTIAQNLFISTKNLLVEGPADLIYLKCLSSIVEQKGYQGLSEEITVVPVGGLDKLVTFISLLGANQLEIVVLHDYDVRPDQRLQSIVQQKLIKEKSVLNYAMFRCKKAGDPLKSTDVEDLFSEKLYLSLFNKAFATTLNGREVKVEDLPLGDRIVDRINRFLKDQGIQLRPSGGFNHYLVANYLVAHPLPASKIDSITLQNFSEAFKTINALIG